MSRHESIPWIGGMFHAGPVSPPAVGSLPLLAINILLLLGDPGGVVSRLTGMGAREGVMRRIMRGVRLVGEERMRSAATGAGGALTMRCGVFIGPLDTARGDVWMGGMFGTDARAASR